MKQILIYVGLLVVISLGVLIWQTFPAEISAPSEDSSLSNITTRGTLVVGSDIPYGVMEFLDEANTPQGIDIDIARSIAKKLGVSMETKDLPWDQLFVSLEKGDIDIALSSITITPERGKEMLFSIPYFNGGQSIVAQKDDKNITSLESLKDKKVGVQVDTTGDTLARAHDASVITYPTVDDNPDATSGIVVDLKQGELNAAIVDYIAAISIVKKHPTLHIVGTPITQEYYGIAARKGSDSLVAAIDSHLRKMKDSGELKTIVDSWVRP